MLNQENMSTIFPRTYCNLEMTFLGLTTKHLYHCLLFSLFYVFYLKIKNSTELIEMQNGECKCLTSCNDEKLLLQSTNSFYWLREPSLHFDLEKIKTAYRRQVIFGWRELLGNPGYKILDDDVCSLNS